MIRSRWLFPLILFAACGGTQEGSTTPGGGGGGGGGGGSKPAQAGDVSIDVPAFQIKGVLFEPQALGRPGIPTSPPKKKTTIDKQRALVASTKDPVQKQAHAVGLATMIYLDAKANAANEKAMMEDARKVLRDVAAAVGNKADETLLLFLASYEMYFEDWAEADKAWAALITKSPKDPQMPYFKTWWTYALLRQFKNKEAVDAVQGEPIDAKYPELAYAAAWAKWRANDDAGAWQAMVAAEKGWPGDRKIIDDEAYLLAARSNTPLDQATQQLYAIFGAKTPAQQYPILAKLGLRAYGNSGRWADAIAALDKAIANAPVNDVPLVRYSQADYMVRLDDPVKAATYAKQAVDALPACGAKCSDKEKQDLVTAVAGIARVFHFVYATSNDVRYYQPANDLYLLTIPLIMDSAMRSERNKDAETLQRTLKNTKQGTGTHDKDAIRVLAERHNLEIQACYEGVLVSNPKLGGNLVLNLESDATGAIKGASTEPKGGAADMAAVATCVVEHAKQWKLPKRGMPGNTRIKLTYQLAKK